MTAPPRRILLIDDTPEIAELLTFALRDRGYDVIAAGYTDTGSQRIVDARADALVLDCSAYDMSESLFDMVRDDPAHADSDRDISDTPEEADRSLRARQADHVLLIPKPFTGAQIARALDEPRANHPITRSPNHPILSSHAFVEHGRLATLSVGSSPIRRGGSGVGLMDARSGGRS